MGFGTLIQRITYKVSGRTSTSSGLYTPSSYQYDYALGGQPLLSATTDSRPDTEKLADQKKQQFDNYKEPGEYSLTQWWLRSQSSFIGGAGVIYQDPDTQGNSLNIRYGKSIGIDPFSDVDNAILLKESNPTTLLNGLGVGPVYLEGLTSSLFGDLVFAAQAPYWYSQTVGVSDLPAMAPINMAPGAGASSVLSGGLVTIASAGQQFANAYCFLNDSTVGGPQTGVYRLTRGIGLPTSNRIYVVPPTSASGLGITLGASRGSLLLAQDNKLYSLDPYAAPGSALPVVNAQIPQGQMIVSITDGPDAAYIGANSFNQGYIYKTTVDNNGVINGLSLTAVLPEGELICDAQAYINTFMVISTTIGIRIGNFTAGFSGAVLAYGPKIITVPRTGTLFGGPESGSGFGRIAFYGAKAYITTQGTPQHDGLFGLMAVDLSTLVQNNNTGATFNPYCTWDYAANTVLPITDVTVTATGRCVFSSGSDGTAKIFLEHQNNYIASGYLDTGRCRFNTIEPKLFKYLSVKTPTPLQGELTVTLLDDTGGITNYITYGPTLDPGTSDISTSTPTGPRNWEAFRFTLKRGATDPTVGAKLDAWQIKALPGVLKQRHITRNFLCFNSMKDKSGQIIQGDTQSLDILTAIRQMAQRGDTITLQDLVNNIATQVIIDDYQFTMLAPPGPNKENYGGYLTIDMRTVADSVPPVPQLPAEVD
jgi:hypothetical protein